MASGDTAGAGDHRHSAPAPIADRKIHQIKTVAPCQNRQQPSMPSDPLAETSWGRRASMTTIIHAAEQGIASGTPDGASAHAGVLERRSLHRRSAAVRCRDRGNLHGLAKLNPGDPRGADGKFQSFSKELLGCRLGIESDIRGPALLIREH